MIFSIKYKNYNDSKNTTKAINVLIVIIVICFVLFINQLDKVIDTSIYDTVLEHNRNLSDSVFIYLSICIVSLTLAIILKKHKWKKVPLRFDMEGKNIYINIKEQLDPSSIYKVIIWGYVQGINNRIDIYYPKRQRVSFQFENDKSFESAQKHLLILNPQLREKTEYNE